MIPSPQQYTGLFPSARPMKLESCRVWRSFLGGKLIDEWRGAPEGKDTHWPEDWLGSTVKARNAGREEFTEGYSAVSIPADGNEYKVLLKDLISSDPEGMLGKDHVDRLGTDTGMLTKLVDSAQRLTLQVHPTPEAARRYFNFPFGKTEAWHIVGTRRIGEVEPYVLLGFKEGITREKWRSVYQRQDIPEMIDLLHRVPVQPGDVLLIRSGTPHGMGEGVFFVEIQEPCDITLRTEKVTPTGKPLTDEICTCGLGEEGMLDQFIYQGRSYSELLTSCLIQPASVAKGPGFLVTELIGRDTREYFSIYRIECAGAACSFAVAGHAVLLVNRGNGWLNCRAGQVRLCKGETWFIPADVRDIVWQSDGELELLLCCPPGSQSE